MLFPGKSMYAPAEVAVKAVTLLQRLAAVHRSSNIKSVPFYPIPRSKRIVSNPDHLLSSDCKVVETAAELPVESIHSPTASSTSRGVLLS